MKKSSFRVQGTCLGLILLLFGIPAWSLADDVIDQVNEAMQAYAEKDYPIAAQGLETAAQMIRQLRGEGLQGLLPEALKDWTADPATSESAQAVMLGGAVTASRTYRKGNAEVTIQYITDSPMLQSMMMMFNMPMMAQSSGMKLERIKGQKAMVKQDDLQINLVVGGTMLVQIDGSDCELDDLRQYAAAIDYDTLIRAL